jgi:tripartite-type tricarboxylate transporter receptor subunit TctC
MTIAATQETAVQRAECRVRALRLAMPVAALALMALTPPAHGQSADDFFRSASLVMYVGSGAGGGYDAVGRLVARHMSRFLPGNPAFVVKNMPSASGVQSANFLYNAAPRDGSTILAVPNAPLVLPLYDSPVAHFDSRKFEWIGSTDKQQAVCLTWHTSAIKTLADATKREVPVAATGVSAGPGIYPKIMNTLFGTRFKTITGYDTGGMRLAMEKGEVEGICGLAWQTFKLTSPDWIAARKLNVLTQMGLEKNAELADVPMAVDLIRNPDDRQVLELIVLPQEFGRPFIAPPGVPADRMAAYRKAFQAMLKDQQFLAESARQRMSIEPLDDRQILALFDRAYAAPKPIHDRAAVFAAELN